MLVRIPYANFEESSYSTKCPECNTVEIDDIGFDREDGSVQMRCDKCEHEWEEKWIRIGEIIDE